MDKSIKFVLVFLTVLLSLGITMVWYATVTPGDQILISICGGWLAGMSFVLITYSVYAAVNLTGRNNRR